MGIEVTVKQVAKLPDGDEGHAHWQKREIVISKEYPLEQRLRTYKHEVFHMVLGLSGVSELLTTEQEEAVVVALENHL